MNMTTTTTIMRALRRVRPVTLTTLAAVLGSASVALAEPEATVVSAIEARDTSTGRELVIKTSRTPTFSVFRMTAPTRLLVDVSNAEVASDVSAPGADALVTSVKASKLADDHVVRIEITLATDVEYDAKATSDAVVVTLAGPRAAAAPAATQLGRLDRKVKGDRVVFGIPFTGVAPSPSAVAIQQLEEPRRIVIDVAGASAEPKWQKVPVNALGIQRARLGVQDDSVRVVLDLEQDAAQPEVDVAADANRLLLTVTRPAKAPAVATAEAPKVELVAAPVAPAAPSPAAPAPAATEPAKIAAIKFEPKDGFYRLSVELPAEMTVVKDGASTRELPMLRIPGTSLPEALVRTLDTSGVGGGVVSSISSYVDGGDTVLAANVGAATEHRFWQKDNKLFWDFRGAGETASVVAQPAVATAGFQSQATGTLTAQSRSRYTGRRISLDLKDADIQNVLRLLADVSQLNIIAGSDVTGKVTLKLKNVPWDQALDIILQSKSYDKVRSGNIIRVAPIEVLEREAQSRASREKAQADTEPLNVRLVPVSYAVAQEISQQASALLSSRGKLNVDARTNVLVVEDVVAVLDKIERLVRTLDTQTPQVLIEARIVQARTNFARQLGIQWGGSFNFSQAFGNSTGLGFPNEIAIAGASGSAPAAGLAGTPSYLVNLPAAIGQGSGGGVGFTFGSAGGAALMHLRLSAAESDGKSKIVSAPKVVTLDNKGARIVAGEQIPITVVTANGPSTRFISANLELNVTPHVTTEGAILMKIKAAQNELSQRVDTFGTPGILTREAETEMLVPDGETAVLGGIYRRSSIESRDFVPFLGEIPVLGWLFKTKRNVDDRDELLIFISPRIVNRSQSVVNAQ